MITTELQLNKINFNKQWLCSSRHLQSCCNVCQLRREMARLTGNEQ